MAAATGNPRTGGRGTTRRGRRGIRTILSLGALAGLLLGGPWLIPAAAASPAAKDREDAVLPFATDVYVISGTGDLIPVDPGRTPPETALYNLAGASLGVTWGRFSDTSATAKAKVSAHKAGERTDVHLHLDGLIPHGVYSLFYTTFGPDSDNPLCPGVDRSLALTSADAGQQPDAASFVANARGKADFHARVPGDLLGATMLAYTVIYHADGHTYGALANRSESESQGEAECRSSYGVDAIRQVLIWQKFQ